MLKVNNHIVEKENFLSGEQRLNIPPIRLNRADRSRPCIVITWFYENDSELFTLQCLVPYLRQQYGNVKLILTMPYIPHARMDRVEDMSNVFTLKYFCQIINSLKFDKVQVLDAHSNVALALLDNVSEFYLKGLALGLITNPEFTQRPVIYFPDAGACKRYKKLFADIEDIVIIYGEKVRDWSTGKIKKLEIKTDNADPSKLQEAIEGGSAVIMFDDIVSYGGTFYYSALELKKLGFNEIYAYASHTENSILDKEHGTFIKLLNDGTVKKLFTTNSIYRGNDEHIEIIWEF